MTTEALPLLREIQLGKDVFLPTVGVVIPFLHNRFSLLALDEQNLNDTDTARITRAVVDVRLPITLRVTSIRPWQAGSRY